MRGGHGGTVGNVAWHLGDIVLCGNLEKTERVDRDGHRLRSDDVIDRASARSLLLGKIVGVRVDRMAVDLQRFERHLSRVVVGARGQIRALHSPMDFASGLGSGGSTSALVAVGVDGDDSATVAPPASPGPRPTPGPWAPTPPAGAGPPSPFGPPTPGDPSLHFSARTRMFYALDSRNANVLSTARANQGRRKQPAGLRNFRKIQIFSTFFENFRTPTTTTTSIYTTIINI